jgi:hypothetical protein
MRARATLVLAVVGGTMASARAQTAQVWTDAAHTTPVVMSFSLTFSEFNAATMLPVSQSNGVIDPGELANIRLAISTVPIPTFSGTNPTTAAYWNPAVVGGHGSGWLWGIGSMFIDVVGDGGASSAQGTWASTGGQNNLRGVLGSWAVGDTTTMGTPAQGGTRMANIQAGQFGGNLLNLSRVNPVTNIWRGMWTPSSFAPRNVTFAVADNSAGYPDASAILADSTFPASTYPLAANVGVNFGSVSIPIGIPGPSSPLLLGSASFLAIRRRRCRLLPLRSAHSTPMHLSQDEAVYCVAHAASLGLPVKEN